MSATSDKISTGFKGAAEMTGLSTRTLQLAAKDPNPKRRLKTVRFGRRRLIRYEDLREWFARVSREEEEPQAA
jgi:excisionase family DNA binding protein